MIVTQRDRSVQNLFRVSNWKEEWQIYCTHVVSVALWHEHVHFRGFGADDLDVKRLRRQVDLTPVRFVDRYRRHFAQNLIKHNLRIQHINIK